MSLCDPISVLERLNKNMISEVMENLIKKREPIPIDYLHMWKRFVFREYFPFIFEMAENAFFTNVTVHKKNVVSFKRFTNEETIENAIQKKKILVSLYKAPEWFAKTYHQLNEQETSNLDLSDYLYICYNPTEDEGKKVTVSIHTMKTPQQVLEAELNYKRPITKKTFIGLTSTVISIIISIANYAHVDFVNIQEILTFGPLLLIAGLGFIFFDARQLVNNVHNGSLNKLVTKHKKTMKKRLDSSHSLIFLETFNRQIQATIASTVLTLIKNSPERLFINEDILLNQVQNKLSTSISGFELSQVLSVLIENNLIEITNGMEISLLVQDTEFANKARLDEKLLDFFDIAPDLQTKLFELYRYFRKIVLEICDIAHLIPPMFPKC